jgi:hypothetical protein
VENKDYGSYEGYSESKFRLAVKKASNEKNFIIHKNAYILKLLLNVGTARIGTFVLSRSKFLYACVKEVCGGPFRTQGVEC